MIVQIVSTLLFYGCENDMMRILSDAKALHSSSKGVRISYPDPSDKSVDIEGHTFKKNRDDMKNKIVTYLCFLITMAFGMVLTSYSPMLPSISKTFSLTLTQSGFIFTANFIGFVAFVLIGGVLADCIGKKTILEIATGGFAVSLIVFPFSNNFSVACLVMALIGGFGGIIESITNAVVVDLNPHKASFYVNMVSIFFGIGAIIGPIIAGAVIALGIRWQIFYFVLGLVSAVLTVLLAIEKVPYQQNEESISWPIFKGLVTDGRFLLICLCMFLYTGSEVGSWGWMSTFLKENMNFGIFKSGIAVAAFWASVTISRFMCGYLALKYNTKYIIIILAAFASLFVLLSGFELGEGMMWFVIIGLGFSFSSQWPLIATFGSQHYPASAGTVFALLVGSGGLGGMIIPYAMGYIGERYNTRIAAMSPSILFLVIVVVFIFIDKTRRSAQL